MAAAFAGRFLASSRSSKRRQLRWLTLFVAAVISLCGLSWCQSRAFATVHMAAKPAVVDRPTTDQGEATDEDMEGGKKRKKKDKDDVLKNITLQLSDGFPGSTGPSVGQGPPWATCFADVEVKNTDQVDGTVTRSNVLEQWVMRGDRQNTDAFINWRQMMASGAPVSVRCSQTNLKDAEDVVCLECVSHVGGLPFTADSPIVPSGFIVSDFQQCMRRSFDGTGFCKSASLVL